MPALKIAICGATGRTGSRVAALADSDRRFLVAARFGRANASRLDAALEGCGAVIDFTAPEATTRFAAACARARVPFVTGTTGLSGAQRARLEAAATRTPVFAAANFSRGVAVLLRLAAEAARLLPGYDAAIVEAHRRGKKDAPSGTALRLAESVMAGRRDRRPVPTSSLRVGDVPGDHALTLAGPGERVELAHRAESRDVFAEGALEAALWVARRRPGLYGMSDLLASGGRAR